MWEILNFFIDFVVVSLIKCGMINRFAHGGDEVDHLTKKKTERKIEKEKKCIQKGKETKKEMEEENERKGINKKRKFKHIFLIVFKLFSIFA